MALPTAWAIATGRLGLGLALLIASAVPDLLDGALAKASGRSSSRGAFFDSVADRLTDALVLGAFAWYLQDKGRGHYDLLPLAVLGVSMIVSYERAKAESLGFSAKGGLMERAERIVVLCAALAFSRFMLPLLWVMFALTSATALQRFVMVWRQANQAGQRPPVVERERRVFVRSANDPTAVAERFRAWRESYGWEARARRYGSGAPRGTAASRWHDRREARRRLKEGSLAEPARRRPGSRRP
jgi:CDP-diacylglycerol--glycerol-3-phosphate 3-phosphatidyltransferase